MRMLRTIALTIIAVLAAPVAGAAEFPTKPVRLLVPFAAGGATDTFARIVAEGLSKRWEQPVVVENRAGGNTIVATTALAKAEPDGYTLGMMTSSFVINPGIRETLPYDTLADFAGISTIARFPIALVVHPDYPAMSMKEFVDYAQEQPDPILMASSGTGNITHLLGLLTAGQTGFKVDPVSYNGSAEAIPDVLAGRVPVAVDSYAFLRPYVESGKLRLLAFYTEERSPEFKDIPTFAETYPELAGSSEIGIIAPNATPREILEIISADIQAVVGSPAFVTRAATLGAYAGASTPEETDEIIEREIAKWSAVASNAGIKVE